ncbi:MAG: signal peptidase II [Candidatus Omnitrophica bacterium]|nr:signal peptidase II [Candidatus Omnitrophota bacterium]
MTGAFFVLFVALCAGALDRLSKYAVCASLGYGGSVPVVPGIFHLTLTRNTGAAFGILKDGRFFFIGASLAAIAAIAVYISRRSPKDMLVSLALGLILGGASGNLVDRIRYGYVIDFLDFRVWPVFNIADSCITIGTIILVLKICIPYSSK